MQNTIQLSNKDEIPQIGLGTWLIEDESECKNAVKTALEVGYRHIDTAQIYENEQYVGEAIVESKIKREDIFITTKIWNDNMNWDDVEPSFRESLSNLQTDYVDLLLMHFPVTELRRPAWHKMEVLSRSGKVRAIGVSNYTIRHLEELLSECEVKPLVNQVELHVYLQQPELVNYCEQNEIAIEAYSPLAHGWNMDNEILVDIGKKHKKSAAQIMIRWCIEKGFVVIPKSSNPEHIKENFEVFDFSLENEDMDRLEKLDRNFRTCWDPTNVS